MASLPTKTIHFTWIYMGLLVLEAASKLTIKWEGNELCTCCKVAEFEGEVLNKDVIELKWNDPNITECGSIPVYYAQCSTDFYAMENVDTYSTTAATFDSDKQTFRKTLGGIRSKTYYCAVGIPKDLILYLTGPIQIKIDDGLSTLAIIIIVFGVLAAVGGIVGAVIAFKKFRPRQWEAFETSVRNSIRRVSMRRSGRRFQNADPATTTAASAEHPTTAAPKTDRRRQPIQLQQNANNPATATAASAKHPTTAAPSSDRRRQPIQLQQNLELEMELVNNTQQQPPPPPPPQRQQFHHHLQNNQLKNTNRLRDNNRNTPPTENDDIPPNYLEVYPPHQDASHGHQNPPANNRRPIAPSTAQRHYEYTGQNSPTSHKQPHPPRSHGQENEGFNLDV